MIPKVSIIVPVFNVESYLDICVNSLINQTLKDIEIILVDDGSPDSCPQLCDDYVKLDSRIKVIHKKNEGLGFARNSGMQLAVGEYIAFVDSDDWVESSMYENLYNTAQKENLDTCYCGFYNVSSTGVLSNKQEVIEFEKYRGRKEVNNFLLNMIAPEPSFTHDVRYMMSVCKVIFKRSIIKDNNLSFHSEREYVSEDMFFQFDYLLKADAIGFLPTAFYYYRMNPKSLSHTWSREKYDKILIYLNELRRKLSLNFTSDVYNQHFYRHCFLYLRNTIKIGCNNVRYKTINASIRLIRELEDAPIMKEMISHYAFSRLPLKQYLLFFSFKYKLYFLTYIYAKYF